MGRRMEGGFFNRLMERSKPPAPQVGQGATSILYSDRHAYTIARVEGNRLWAQRDNVKRTDALGMSDAQQYSYESNPAATMEEFSLRKNGKWVAKGESQNNGTILLPGVRDEYYDYSF